MKSIATDFMQQALKLSPSSAPAWLAPAQDAGRNTWLNSTFPTRKTEDWKYTSLHALETQDYFAAPANTDLDPSVLEKHSIRSLEGIALVFVNGVFKPDASSKQALPDGVELTTFTQASAAQGEYLSQALGKALVSDKHLFAALNASQINEGVFLRVKRNIQLDKPVQIIHITTTQPVRFSCSQRVLVVLEEGSEATVVEQFVSDETEQNSFITNVTELNVHNNARLHHYRIHREQEDALHIGGVHATLGRDAVLNSFNLALGAQLKRIDFVVNHQGEGAHCELKGVYLPRNKQHVDYHTCIEHAVPHCTTNEVFRGIIADRARAVFNGRIHIHPQAQKTLAQLSNKNLLTSDKAEVNTKPELEIYADDVQCAHGATVAQLDTQALHYLRTRGVSSEEAQVMLSFGFINELINDVQHQPIIDYLRPLLVQLFSRDPMLTRHLL